MFVTVKKVNFYTLFRQILHRRMSIIVNKLYKRKEFVMNRLWCKIEILRRRMYEMGLKKGISHPDTLMASQRLDEVINELYKSVLIQKGG